MEHCSACPAVSSPRSAAESPLRLARSAAAATTDLNIILNKMAERPSQEDLHKAFRLFDPAGKRRVDFADLKRIAGQIGEQIEDEELQDMITEADHSGTGEVNQEDFFKIVTSYAQHYDGER